ncbi:hypothetical protein KAH37_09395, partial [bacterium]|nr:hypothetical protein [bacterium]
FAQEGKLHMTPKVGLGFGFRPWNMIGISAGFDASYRVLTIKKKPGMGLYVGGEVDFIVWPPIGSSTWWTTNSAIFQIPILGTVRFQLPVKRVFIIPFVQTGVAINFATNGGGAGAGFAFNFGAEFVFKKKIVLRPHIDASAGRWGGGASFMVDIGYRISK